jgi:hypothetical protein
MAVEELLRAEFEIIDFIMERIECEIEAIDFIMEMIDCEFELIDFALHPIRIELEIHTLVGCLPFGQVLPPLSLALLE